VKKHSDAVLPFSPLRFFTIGSL